MLGENKLINMDDDFIRSKLQKSVLKWILQ